ncbi:uncharacterized protein METZ01_LOCUS229964 [marine metagenome]|uniref:Uncharacterized protein n=1 Tax=marine metagenome TaxID=408172 RepID=A0A382GPQ9_9ZZZZ
MGPIMGALSTVGGWAKSVTDFGLTIITALIVLDILYPNSSYITENLARVVGDFGDQGVAGLIVVLLFLVLYRRG